MPKPPAAFSPLMTTKSSRWRSIEAGQPLGDRGPAGPPDDVTEEEKTQSIPSRSAPVRRRRRDQLVLGDDEVERNIERLERNRLDLLDREGNADQPRREPASRERIDRAVVMALAIADAVPPRSKAASGTRSDVGRHGRRGGRFAACRNAGRHQRSPWRQRRKPSPPAQAPAARSARPCRGPSSSGPGSASLRIGQIAGDERPRAAASSGERARPRGGIGAIALGDTRRAGRARRRAARLWSEMRSAVVGRCLLGCRTEGWRAHVGRWN